MPTPHPASSTQGTDCLLLVEDDHQLLTLLRDYLEADGYQVSTAASVGVIGHA
jgi:DNA-binding response OmpR family regulator